MLLSCPSGGQGSSLNIFLAHLKLTPRKYVLYWLPVVVLCLAIYTLSSFPSPDTGPDFPLKDKMQHVAAYGLLAALFARACRMTWPDWMSPIPLMLISVCFATLYGLSDEFHQSFIAERHADAMDAVADFVGSVLGALLYILIISWRGRHRLPKTG